MSRSAGGSTSAGAGEPTVVVASKPDSVAETSAAILAGWLIAAVAERGRADIALTGGSTPRAMYRHLRAPALRDRIPWDQIHLWWGDDRFVPRADRLSNVSVADEELLGPDGVPIPARNVHPFPTDEAIREGRDPDWCAERYAAALAAAVAATDGWPAFDAVLVGIGPDGHLLSVFPGSPALADRRVALGIPAPTHVEPHVPRVTVNPAILGAARHVMATATGSAKASVVARILAGPRDPAVLPGVLARRASATWLLDGAAASALDEARTAGGSDRGPVVLRRAIAADAAEVAEVWLAAFAATYAFPHAHADDEVRAWIRDELVPTTETWLAIDPEGSIAGFMCLTPDLLDQLYVRPDRTGQGIGGRLVELAKALRPNGLDLYTFQVNSGARRFYERNGFRAIAFDDEGGGNEEGQPDVRYRWRPASLATAAPSSRAAASSSGVASS